MTKNLLSGKISSKDFINSSSSTILFDSPGDLTFTLGPSAFPKPYNIRKGDLNHIFRVGRTFGNTGSLRQVLRKRREKPQYTFKSFKKLFYSSPFPTDEKAGAKVKECSNHNI